MTSSKNYPIFRFFVMDFNFLETYKDYSTADLLKIVQRPDNYQPAAVDAAKEILGNRQIAESDVQQVNEYFQVLEDEKERKRWKVKVNEYIDNSSEFFESITGPGKGAPAKWLNYILALIALQYIWVLYKAIKHCIFFSQLPVLQF